MSEGQQVAEVLARVNTFIIPVLNNYKGLLRLLQTLKDNTPENYKVVVINNGYSLQLENIDIDYREDCKSYVDLWIDTKKNLGFGRSINIGIKLANTKYVTVANDDVEIMYPEWWKEIERLFREDKHLGGFNPHSPCNKKHTGERCIQYDYKDKYTREDIVKMKEIFHNEKEYTGCCTYFTICKKQMFDEIGLFDESFGLGSGEDYDLCVRAYKAGWKIKGGSRVMVWHWWGNTKDNMPKDNSFISNYDLIAGGNQNMERKWGKHVDKVAGGWNVSGVGGPDEPLDKDTVNYKNNQWYQEVEYD